MFIPSADKLPFAPARYSEPPPISLPSDPENALALACRIDRAADAELQHGHTIAAELLAQKAAELREGVDAPR